MNAYSVIFFTKGEYEYISCPTYQECLYQLDTIADDFSVEPIGIYQASTDRFEWRFRPNMTPDSTYSPIHQATLLHTISTVCKGLQKAYTCNGISRNILLT
jgi:hypothetical protein